MDKNDDPLDGPSDALVEALRKDALANRAAFSPELQQRILQHIRAEGVHRDQIRIRYGVVAAAIAASLSIGVWAMWHLPRRQPEMNIAQKIIPPAQTSAVAVRSSPLVPMEFEIKGLASASLWPPEIRIELPDVLATPQSPTRETAGESAPQGLPQVLIGAMQQQTVDANAALTSVIPANLRFLYSAAQPQKNDEDFR